LLAFLHIVFGFFYNETITLHVFYICYRKVKDRELSNGNLSHPRSVIMKMDIEGSEIEVLTDLITSGALQVAKKSFFYVWQALKYR
jgi:hypothetical protein